MVRYSATSVVEAGFVIIELRDEATGSVASIVPEIGNNLYRFESRGHCVISSPIDVATLKNEAFAAFRYGTPILSPPNRVKQGTFCFNEREYRLPINEPPDFHLHGEMSCKAWEVLDFGTSDRDGAFVTCQFRYANFDDILSYFPHPLSFTVTYRLHEGALAFNVTVVNEGNDAAPFGFGLHPYFSIPFSGGGDVVLTVPATEEWPITNLATVVGEASVTDLSRSVNNGLSIADYPLLGCSMLSLAEGENVCRISVSNEAYTIAYKLGREFPFALIFRPDWSDAFSIEPYSCVTDAFNLPYAWSKTGARGIEAGEEIHLNTVVWIEK